LFLQNGKLFIVRHTHGFPYYRKKMLVKIRLHSIPIYVNIEKDLKHKKISGSVHFLKKISKILFPINFSPFSMNRQWAQTGLSGCKNDARLYS